MFKLAVIQTFYGVKTRWNERKIQGTLVVWFIIIIANSIAWFEKDSIAWFWTTYGVLLKSMSMFSIDENVFPEVFRFLPITQEKKKSFLFFRASIESIFEMIAMGIMLLIFMGINGSMDLLIVVEAILFLAFSTERFGQNLIFGFCKIAGIKHIYECEPEKKSMKIMYWLIISFEVIVILVLLIMVFFIKDTLTVGIVWRIGGICFIYYSLSTVWKVQTLKKCMNRIEW